ncbi:MAG: hypothetical protein ACKOXB_15750 [Flavobacteriales bacterium]
MKKTFTLGLLLTAILFSFAPASNTPSIVVKGGKIKMNKKVVTSDWSLAGFEAIIGKAERIRDGYNVTHTYDNMGIVLFEKKTPTLGTISEVQVYFSAPEANNVTPTGLYRGSMKVGGLALNASLTAEKMLQKLKKWKKTDSYMDHSYRMTNKGLYIYFQFNDSENTLIKASIGPDKRKD